jgi:DNA-binding transcriptional MerR regulator
MRIGELASRTGASVRSLRYYEQQGLLTSGRTSRGQRIFEDAAVERVLLIRRLLDAGLASRTMAELLPCITDPRARTPYLASRLDAERARIQAQIEQLRATVEALGQVICDLAEPAGG